MTVRQVMIVYENVTLTRDLEAKVERVPPSWPRWAPSSPPPATRSSVFSLDGMVIGLEPGRGGLYGHRAAR